MFEHPNSSLRGIIIDDHRLFAAGLRLILENEFNFENLDICYNISEAASKIEKMDGQVDLIISDFYIPGHNAKDIIKYLRNAVPAAKIICVSASSSPEDELAAREVGADLYMRKHTEPSVLLAAIQSLLAGKSPAPCVPKEDALAGLGLTPRQVDILQQIAKGQSNKEIALALNISPETVKTHLAVIYRQTETTNRVSLINWARSVGLFVEN